MDVTKAVDDLVKQTTTAVPPAGPTPHEVPVEQTTTVAPPAESTHDEVPVGQAAVAVPLAESVPVGVPSSNGVADTVEIKIDLDGLMIGDLEVLGRAEEGTLSPRDMVVFLNRVVVGGVGHVPMRHLRSVIEALGKAITESANPGN